MVFRRRSTAVVFAISALSAGFSLIPSEVSAAVTLQGCIKWYHPEYPVNDRWPLKFSEVEVEWDGVGDDPEVLTDANGCYRASVRNAAWGYNGHDMNVQPYAKRAFLGASGRRELYVRVFENMSDAYPTYVESPQIHVNDNSTGTIDMWIGGNQEFGGGRQNFKKGNLALAPRKYYYWNIAAADIIGRYYDAMHTNGFRQHRSVDVISPALGGTAYFNFATNNINLTSSANPQSYGSFAKWVGTLLHEGTHALHAHSSPPNVPVAPGLIMPSVHSMNHETNPQLAWTEAFAEFLPVTYLASWGGLGKYATYDYAPATSDGRKVTYSSLIEDHSERRQPASLVPTSPPQFHVRGSARIGGSEAYVAGFLWDLVDSSAMTEQNPNYRAWRAKIPGGNGSCQLENTSARSYRNLPANSAVLRDSDSNAALAKSTDCLALPVTDISRLVSVRMFSTVSDFGAALIAGRDANTKYEVLKAYANNGMLGAAPIALRGMYDWSLSQAVNSLDAEPSWGDAGRPATATVAQDRAKPSVSIKIPIRLTSGDSIQFENARCKFTSSQAFGGCNTFIPRTGNATPIVRVSFNKSDYCNGTGDVNRDTVGTSEKAPMYVALDDGVNPVAIRVNGICSARIVGR